MSSLATAPATKKEARARRSQLPYAMFAILAVVVVGVLLAQISPQLSTMWIFGLAFGFVLQRSRFCFTASLRDPVLTGSTSLTKAVIIAFAVASVGFAAIQYNAFLAGAKTIPGHISPAGGHTAIGATLFGIGMVIAGGCASGTLMRMGEGFVMQWIAIIGFIIGSLWGIHDYGWWKATFMDKSPTVFLPQVLGWPLAFFGQLVLLGALYLLAEWYGQRSKL